MDVTLISITKGKWLNSFFLDGKKVDCITTYLDDSEQSLNPLSLISNADKSFTGSKVYGEGFILDKNTVQALIKKNITNQNVVFPFLSGDDLNNDIEQKPSRWVINFFDWQEDKCKTEYYDCFDIILKTVKPEREKLPLSNKARRNWWLYERSRNDLYSSLKSKTRALACAMASKHVCFSFTESNIVFMQMVCVFVLDKNIDFAILSSSLHTEWAWKNSSKLGTGTITYSISEAFQTFPFPSKLSQQKEQQLEAIGEAYHEHRRQLMLGMQLGLTKTYNLFHSNAITAQSVNDKDKQAASLQKHLDKTANTISFDEAIQGILKLRELHVQMDETVLDAYGWSNDELKITNYDTTSGAVIRNSQLKIDLKHDFYEVDYLPENDRVRFTIHPDARKEVLKRLLDLNHKIHKEEKGG